MILVFTVSPLDAPLLPPVAHETGRHQGQDDGHEQEAHPADHPGQQRLWDVLQEAGTDRVHLHACESAEAHPLVSY